jgi:MFS family permease
VPSAAPPATPATAFPGRLVGLLAAAVFINYFDRGNLSVAAPQLMTELSLSNPEMGVLFAAFFIPYALLQPFAGWFAQRVDLRWMLGGGLALWALATMLTGLASGFAALLALRVLLGLGESVAYPCNALLLARHVGFAARAEANGLIAVGQALGPTAGTLLGGLLMEHYGWRPAFVVFGLASLLWLLPWIRVTRREPLTGTPGVPPVRLRALLWERSLWGTSLGHFSGNYAYYFTLSWLPLMLVRKFGFSLSAMAMIGAGVYAVQAVVAPSIGWLCDRLIRRGMHPSPVLKSTIVAGHIGVTLTMAACANASATTSVVLLLVSGAFFGVQSAPLGAISQTLAGPRAAGQWMGIQNLCANLAGVIAPSLTGIIVGRTGSFAWAFAIAAAVTLVGAFAFAAVVRRVEPVDWRGEPAPPG